MGTILSSRRSQPRINPSTPNQEFQEGGDIGAESGLKFEKGGAFSQKYILGKKLGQGGFAVVHLCTDKATTEKYAAKIVVREKLAPSDEDDLKREVSILQLLQHPNIVVLYQFLPEKRYYILVQELMAGGELFDRISSKIVYSEKDARDVVILLLQAIAYCHSQGVVHRDLKPENLLLISPDDDHSLKIADFGLAIKLAPGETTSDASGTPQYVAPQLLRGQEYGVEADMWSIGVITYILLGGYPPFSEENDEELFRKIKAGKYHFHEKYWNHISQEAKDIIAKMLTVDKNDRITAKNALRHPWLRSSDDVLGATDLRENLAEMQKFNAKRRLKKGVQVVKILNVFNSCSVREGSVSAAAPGQRKKSLQANNNVHEESLVESMSMNECAESPDSKGGN